MATWDAWLPYVMVYAPSAPIPLVEQEVRRASHEFFRRTRAWVEWLEPVLSSATPLTEYAFTPPIGTDVVRIEQATIDGNQVPISSSREIAQDWERQAMDAVQLVSRDLKTFRLGGIGADGSVVRVQAALVPSIASDGIPDELFEKYVDDIAHGVRAKIAAIPETPFYNPDLYMVERSAFEAAIAAKSVDAWRGLTKNTRRVRLNLC